MSRSIIKKIQNKIEAEESNLPTVLFNSIQYRVKRIPQIFYFNIMLHNKILAEAFPFKRPPILLLSFARSGSSWAGKILSFAPDIAYLREPLTQTFIQKLNCDPPFFRSDDEKMREQFKKIANKSFAGIPPIPGLIKNKSDFFPIRRIKKRLLIKEVTPLAADYYREQYSPTMMVLIRHPAAIADSHIRMGWLKDDFEMFGYNYGNQMAKAIQAAKKGRYRIIFYEDLAKNPDKEYSRLLEFLDCRKPVHFYQIIEEYCKQGNREADPYHNKRKSVDEIYKWKRNLDPAIIASVRKGYLESELNYYRDLNDW